MHPLLLAVLAALLFGASTPASKALLGELTPRHEKLTHSHRHISDLHHRHSH